MHDIKTKKLELIAWISQLEDKEIIDKIYKLHNEYEIYEWQKK